MIKIIPQQKESLILTLI